MLTEGHLPGPVRKFRERIATLYRSVRRSREPLDIADLAVTGWDIEQAGFSGPAVGQMLQKLRSEVLRNPALNKKDLLLKLL
jgi:hypothetical protein